MVRSTWRVSASSTGGVEMSKDLRKVRSEELGEVEEEERCVLPWWAFCPKGRPPDPPDKSSAPGPVNRGESR
jgi:hypothetical protein